MRTKRHLTVLALVLGLVCLLAEAAAAKGPIRLVEAGGVNFPERALVLSLPEKKRLTEERLTIRENGVIVPDFSLTPVGDGKGASAGVVLLIDASKSMAGAPIRNAMAAARAFAAQRRPSQRLAVLAYNADTQTVLPFTSDHDEIEDALGGTPKIAYFTRMYEAIDEAISLIKQENLSPGSIVLLSDGQEVGSLSSPAAAIAKARDAHIRVFSVGLRSRYYKAETLRALAASTGGRYREASSPKALRAIYSELGSQLAREYRLRYESSAAKGQRVRVAIRIEGVRGLVVSGYNTPPLAPTTGEPFHPSLASRVWQSPLTLLVIGLGTAALLAFAVVLMVRRRPSGLRRRLGQFVSVHPSDGSARDDGLTSRVLTGAERSLESTRVWTRIKDALLLADIGMPAVHVVAWTVAGTLLVSWLLAMVTAPPLAIGGLAVPLAVRAFVLKKIHRKQAQFAEQLPDNLQVLSSALRAGHSFVGALSVVVDDASEPSQSEFRRVVADEQLGVSLEDALEVVVVRMDNRDLKQVSLVAALQRQTGGNMAEVLDRVAETLRERAELRAMVKTLTAQGRMSRWVVSALPVVLLLVISALNPAYVAPLFTQTGGRIALGVAAGMVIAGSLAIKRIVDIKL